MGRRKLTITAEEQEERREQERQRSQSRRRQQQTETVTEVASDPTIRILQVPEAEEEIVGALESSKLAIQDSDSTLGSGRHQSPATLDATLKASEEEQGGHPTDRNSPKKNSSTKDGTSKQVNHPGRDKAEGGTSFSPSCRESTTRRYNLRERLSTTPPTTTSQSATLPTENASKNNPSNHSLSLPIRPRPESTSEGDLSDHGEESAPSAPFARAARTAGTAAQSSSSTHRVRQHRAQQRMARQQQVIREAREPTSQARVLSTQATSDVVAESTAESTAQSTSEILPTETDPLDPPEEDTRAEATALDDALERSVIVVSTDESSCLTHEDEDGCHVASASDENVCTEEAALDNVPTNHTGDDQDIDSIAEERSDRDESGFIVSEESWDLDLEEAASYVSSPPRQPHHAEINTAAARPLASNPLHEIIDAIESAESAASRAFLLRQAEAYRRVFHETLSPGCACA
jgi:hypothetical protein